MPRIESLLSARLFLCPQRVGNRLFFISNLSGRLSLFAMDHGGSVPEPLLPPHIALQNPVLVEGLPFRVLPRLGKILITLDKDGDENYQPMFVPLEGGIPEPAFGDRLADYRVHLMKCDARRNLAYLAAESRKEQMVEAIRADLKSGALEKMGQSPWGSFVQGVNGDHTQAILIDPYTTGDHAIYLWTRSGGERKLLYGAPLEDRAEGQAVPLNAIRDCWFTARNRGLLFVTALFDDAYGLGYLNLKEPDAVKPVAIRGTVHKGAGELTGLEQLRGARYLVKYNIDGCSWMYEGTFDESAMRMKLNTAVVGRGKLTDGVEHAVHYDRASDSYALSFATATSPAQIYTVEGAKRKTVVAHTRERILDIPEDHLSTGEDASFVSFDRRRVSARLYLPAKSSGFKGPRPLVYYVHGGPQSQERPDFTWFSMPLIQFLTLNGFAVFVPNVRGSTGYGLSYTKKVDRDWGGDDRLDHVHAMKLLKKDRRLDASHAAVVGRSYGGYMTLTLAARHPELWSAACDMFGPYDLFTFMDRIPETWKPYFRIAIGDPDKDRGHLIERSPKTHIDRIACPLLVIQGKNDPRVVERESRDVVEGLRANGKTVEYLVFDDEGHDVLKFDNRVRCYNEIADFFKQHLMSH
ncbi:MAG: S9 family peptidase [Chloroflexi bacterium]|nr:S9 family peptidase [Chloroflexota bacterium]